MTDIWEDCAEESTLDETLRRGESLRARLLDALEHYGDSFDDDALFCERSEWAAGGMGFAKSGGSGLFGAENLLGQESFFAEARAVSRSLCRDNPYAAGAIENRINFVVGNGHRYHAVPKTRSAEALTDDVQREIDDFILRNHWHARQQEIQRRKDRDGEAFLRFFRDASDRVVVRFVEPEQVTTPTGELAASDSLGIKTDPRDVENVVGYWVDSLLVPASSIQHRKSGVDANVKRGLPLLWSVRKNLARAEKLLRNMSVVAEIQSAIALIRKHSGSSPESIRQYLRQQSSPKPVNGTLRQKFSPGTIIDASAGIDYQFPIAAIDAARYIRILQAELRAIASRLVMPEFMLSSDASNANYASTLIAEGPAIRMFERLQTEMIRDDLDLLRRVVRDAAVSGRLPEDFERFVTITAVPPTLAVRDRLSEAKADEILLNCGILSPQTMAMRYGLDPSRENESRAQFQKNDNK